MSTTVILPKLPRVTGVEGLGHGVSPADYKPLEGQGRIFCVLQISTLSEFNKYPEPLTNK